MSRRTLPSALLIAATGLLLFVAGRMMLPSAEGTGMDSPDGSGGTEPSTDRRPPLPPGPREVEDVTAQFAEIARARYAPSCRRAGIAWPPKRLMLLGFKREKRLEVWGANGSGRYARLGSHPVLAASGGDGPKRRQGDKQVPEGFYDLTELNPNSAYHLSIRVDYPNREDIEHSALSLPAMGGDIYIHGDNVSIGCLAIGDRAIEELFTLAALVPHGERRIIIAPFDFRRHPAAPLPEEKPWVLNLYGRIKTALREFPAK